MAEVPTKTVETGGDQYGLLKILTIWAAVAVPMPIPAFVISPALFVVGTMQYRRRRVLVARDMEIMP